MLRPPGQVGTDARLLQDVTQLREAGCDEVLPVRAAFIEQARDTAVGIWLQVAECQVFQLPLELPDTQAVRQRCMDVRGELRQFATLVIGQRHGRAHRRQLAGEQHEDDPQVTDDCQQQTAQAFGAAGLAALCMQRPDLFGLALPVHQAFQRRSPAGHGLVSRTRHATRQREPQRRRAGFIVTAEQVQQFDDGLAFGTGSHRQHGTRLASRIGER